MLRSLLSEIHTPGDVGRLFEKLGYVRVDQPFDDARIVARWKAFKVVAADGADAVARSRALAKLLAANSIRGIAAVVGRQRELVLAAPRVGQGGTTKGLTISLTDPTPFALDQLSRLRPRPRTNALSHALFVSELLRSEVVGEQFFRAFRGVLERMVAALGKRKPLADRKLVSLLVLTRMLFLYFVQSKGWLDGRPDYLRSLLDRSLARRRHFHRSVLQPLFFGTLNRPIDRRSADVDLGEIPYLNGGLFELHPAERRLGPAQFPNELWRDTFDDLFERFRFCVHESETNDAIAPDMLGRVFEGLMDDAERRGSGTFYTPERLVRQVVDATVETALTAHMSQLAARRVVTLEPVPTRDRRVAADALRSFTLLDPAVGSGAFLLGALEALCDIRFALNVPGDEPRSKPQLRRDILRSNLFGVDVNPIAVRLAELRLWLAVIADETSNEIASVSPLPNLDGVVRQGNTLLDPIGAARRYGADLFTIRNPTITSVRTARERLFDARGVSQRQGQTVLRQAEAALARQLLNQAITKASRVLEDLVLAARGRDLFGRRSGLTSTQQAQHRRWTRLRRDARRALRQLDDAGLPFFSFEVHAPEVMRDGGFSAVLGNPPWVRSEVLEPSLKSVLKERFSWWQGASRPGFRHLPDLSVAFLERCFELTRAGGVVGLLVPSKVMSAGYGETARYHLVRETSISYIHRVPDTHAAFGATTYPTAIVFRKTKPKRRHQLQLGFGTRTRISQTALRTSGPWILLPDAMRDAIAEFTGSGVPLGEVASPMLGVKTGADGFFVGRVVRRAGATVIVRFDNEEAELETSTIRAALRGRDVRAFAVEPSRVLLWGHGASGKPVANLPSRATEYVRRQRQRLRQRTDYSGGPLWTVFRTRCTLGENPIVWPDLVRRPVAVALRETGHPNSVPLNSCYVAHAPSRESALAWVAVMNSTWAMAYCIAAGDEARGGYRRMNARLAKHMPVPKLDKQGDVATMSAEAHDQDSPIRSTDLDDAVATSLELSRRTQAALRSLAADHR